MDIAIWKPEADKLIKYVKKHWGETTKIHPIEDVREIFKLVAEGEMDYGIVPDKYDQHNLQTTVHCLRTHEVFIVREIITC